MDKEKIELLENFRKLDPENRANILAHVRVAYAAQENTKRQIEQHGLSNPVYTMPGSGPKMHKGGA